MRIHGRAAPVPSGQISLKGNDMTDKEMRKMYGLGMKPIEATRVLERPMNGADFNNQEAMCLMVINDVAKTITPMNTYNGNAGDNFKAIPRPLPEAGSDRWTKYNDKGYKVGKVSGHKALKEIKQAPVTAAK